MLLRAKKSVVLITTNIAQKPKNQLLLKLRHTQKKTTCQYTVEKVSLKKLVTGLLQEIFFLKPFLQASTHKETNVVLVILHGPDVMKIAVLIRPSSHLMETPANHNSPNFLFLLICFYFVQNYKGSAACDAKTANQINGKTSLPAW